MISCAAGRDLGLDVPPTEAVPRVEPMVRRAKQAKIRGVFPTARRPGLHVIELQPGALCAAPAVRRYPGAAPLIAFMHDAPLGGLDRTPLHSVWRSWRRRIEGHVPRHSARAELTADPLCPGPLPLPSAVDSCAACAPERSAGSLAATRTTRARASRRARAALGTSGWGKARKRVRSGRAGRRRR